jgi:hypothetical protein
MNAAEAAAQIAAIHDEWVGTAKYKSVPVAGPDTQYPETEEDVHTIPTSDAVFMRKMKAVLDEYQGKTT